MESTQDMQTMMSVAQNCNGYAPVSEGMQSGGTGESCSNCRNFKHNKCEKDYFDKVLSTLDEQ